MGGGHSVLLIYAMKERGKIGASKESAGVLFDLRSVTSELRRAPLLIEPVK